MGAQSPRSVAELGVRALMAGKPVAIHSVPSKLANIAARLVPRRVSTWVCGQVLKRRV
jgi:short-subunit dehydrogenase